MGLLMIAGMSLHAADYYVSSTNVLGHQAPYTNWSMAATNIQYAVNEANADDTILIGPGFYTLPTNAVYFEDALTASINRLTSAHTNTTTSAP